MAQRGSGQSPPPRQGNPPGPNPGNRAGLIPAANQPGQQNQQQQQFIALPADAFQGVLDYSNQNELKVFKASIEPLETQWDGNPATLRAFLRKVNRRVTMSRWRDIVTIPDDNGINRDLVEEYGRLSMNNVRQHASATWAYRSNKMFQSSMFLYFFLEGSIEDGFMDKISKNREQYRIRNPANAIEWYEDGVCFLKIIIQTAYVDTRATTSLIRDNLRELSTYLSTIENHDVQKFNVYVTEQTSGLHARGEAMNDGDLVNSLFYAYRTIPDAQFREYIKKQQDTYEEGTDITPENLMSRAEQKYLNLTRRGEWQAPSSQDAEIIALKSTINGLKDQLKKRDKRTGGVNDSGSSNQQKGASSTPTNGTSNTSKKKNTSKTPWYTVKPTNGKTTKMHDGKLFHWCPNHGEEGKWVRHKPEDCKAAKSTSSKQESHPKMSIDQALAAIVQAAQEG